MACSPNAHQICSPETPSHKKGISLQLLKGKFQRLVERILILPHIFLGKKLLQKTVQNNEELMTCVYISSVGKSSVSEEAQGKHKEVMLGDKAYI